MELPPQSITFIGVRCQADTVIPAVQVDRQAIRDRVEQVARQHPGGLISVNNLEILSQADPDAPGRA